MIFIMRLSAIQIKEEPNNNCIRINTLFYFTATVSTTFYTYENRFLVLFQFQSDFHFSYFFLAFPSILLLPLFLSN